MKTKTLDYELPAELIAQEPAAVRSAARLLVLDRFTDALTDSQFNHLTEFLRPGDCLVLNDTKVLPARFFARRTTGGGLEGLFLREVAAPPATTGSGSEAAPCPLPAPAARAGSPRREEPAPVAAALTTPPRARVWEILLKGARKVKPGESVDIEDRTRHGFCRARVLEKKPDGVCLLEVEVSTDAQTVLNAVGFPPLPPYIHRDHDPAQAESDLCRYQTVYARCPGAVAAPTAGLHFTDELLARLQAVGIRRACVTLHVGAGTFKPIATDEVEQHEIHREWYRLDAANAEIINATRAQGGRVIAVGTTVTRVLETVAGPGPLAACEGTTQLFITPGYEFKVVEAMVTNFHLPRSTLLALVGAFAGLERMLAAYRHAIAQRYRFYSYGDAMLIA